jgi:hypothetical protein
LPSVDIKDSDVLKVRNGSRISLELPPESAVALIGPDEDLVAIVDTSGATGAYSFSAVFPPTPC